MLLQQQVDDGSPRDVLGRHRGVVGGEVRRRIIAATLGGCEMFGD
jgi:hypothetical protein